MLFRTLIFIFASNLILSASVDKELRPSFATDNDFLSKKVHEFKMDELLKQKYFALDEDLHKDYIVQDINVNDNLSEPHQELLRDTAYTQVVLITAIGILWVFPEDVSNWDKDEIREEGISGKWKENIKAGPVLDEDDVFLNYIGHPVSGAMYYSMARNDGLDPFGSFLFSFAMSTFFWEYGYEAIAETPSIQDLVSTPVIGAFMGEYMYYLEQQLDKNNGLVWGSRYLGNISYAFLDPMGRLAQNLSDLVDTEVTMRYTTYQTSEYMAQNNHNRALEKPSQFSSYNYGFVIDFKF